MDELQKELYKKCLEFCSGGIASNEGITISLNLTEVYVVMKALEDQQRYTHPMLEIPEEAISDK